MPVYLAIRESDADEFILIHSSDTKDKALVLKKDIEETIDRPVKLVCMDPNDCFGAISSFDDILKQFENTKIEFNISSGTKPWSIAVTKLSAKYPNVQLLYVGQNNLIYNYGEVSVHKLEPMSIEDIFMYSQTEVRPRQHVSIDDYTDEDQEFLSEIEKIRARCPKSFNAVTIPHSPSEQDALKNHKSGDIIDPETHSELLWKRSADGKQSVKLCVMDKFFKYRKLEYTSPHALDMLAFSGWFEYKIAEALNSWKYCREVWLNVLFLYKDKYPKNEIDVIANTGGKLLFIECKTQIKEKTDIDKFASAVKNYGRLGAKPLFVTYEEMDQRTIEKCKTNDVAYFSVKGTENPSHWKDALFKKLDEIVNKNNVR